ncbi:unnamed protein product [Ascophyllum nodosum]
MITTLLLALFIVVGIIYWALNREKLPKLSPPTECHLGEGFVSVIVPAYNEGDGIKLTLSTISQHAQEKSRMEIIVVDGGCRDNTMDAVASMKLDIQVSTTTSVGGRGPALNAGASIAKGDLFLFVHADTVVPPSFDAILRTAFLDPKVLMTTFSFGINRALLKGKEPMLMSLMETLANYRTRVFHMPYGDQAFCFTAHKFRAIGGFPDFVMMEDFEVVRRLWREERAGGGEIRVFDEAALCAPRRWEEPGKGPFATFCRNWCYLFMYTKLGVTPMQIFRMYYGWNPETTSGKSN